MDAKTSTSSQARGLRQGSRGGRSAALTCAGSPRTRSHETTTSAQVTAEKTPNEARQPPSQSASGTATAEEIAEPTWIPVVYPPVAVPGRSAKRSLTATGASAPASPMPTPIGHVRRTTSQIPGATARARPKTPISATASPSAVRVPTRPASHAAGGAKSPMQSTGIVPSRPTTACGASRSSSIAGKSGPTPTICGRSVRAARESASSARPRAVTRSCRSYRRARRRRRESGGGRPARCAARASAPPSRPEPRRRP